VNSCDRFDSGLLQRLRLAPEHVLSADPGSFVTLQCRDEKGKRLVLKYAPTGSIDSHRRLTNESLLLTHLPTRPPLRLLVRTDDGPGYLVTEFDSGRLLRPERLDDDSTVAAIADALVAFQSIRITPRSIGIVDREHRATYYLKVLLKNIVHLWPEHLSAAEAVRCLSVVVRALPAILQQRVLCHGDFLPTNLLYHEVDRSVTLTDLEGFMSANHPLFDVLALLTISDRELTRWNWQPGFLRRYLKRSATSVGLDPRSQQFSRAYRGILIFFLVYRLNEAQIGFRQTTYFDGLGKLEYLKRKAVTLITGRRELWPEEAAAVLDVRKRNLRRALSVEGYHEHFETMLASALP
jgi:aminoglycoside phosphotransferase (APT) family kinase protein